MREENFLRTHTFDWSRVRSGLDNLLDAYPASNWFGNNAVRIACAYGHREDALRYRRFMAQPSDRVWPSPQRMQVMLDWLDGDGPYPTGGILADAVLDGDSYEVERLLASGTDPDAIGFTGATPLLVAAGNGRLDEAKALIDAGADVNSVSGKGNTPLRDACFVQDEDMINLLIEKGADPNLPNAAGWLPLAQAVRDKKLVSVELLLKHGADVNGRMPEGWTPVSVAVEIDDVEIARFLLEHGADPKARFDAGGSVLALAKRKNNPAMIALIEEAAK